MGTLYIDRKDLHIKLDGQALAFYSKAGREGLVPINPLKRVVMVGNMNVETSVLGRLSREGISVIFLSGKRLRFCGMLHGKLHNNGALRVKQYEMSLSDFCSKFAVNLMKRKIEAQRSLLESLKEKRPKLRFVLTNASEVLERMVDKLYEGNIKLGSLFGLEGGASAAYFGAYTKAFPGSLNFRIRNKRPPLDPVNAMLSLCYTLLHFELVREIEIIGLDPVIGFYHQFDYGRESLACDLVEPYRPEVERFVWNIFRSRELTGRDFTMNDEKPGCYLKKLSRKRFYPMYEEWAKGQRPKWSEEVRVIARRIMNEENTVY